ncbi:MAG: hypothetical protein FWF45_04795 [Coriobacteriia bacterium]|nr:hypothetical protein [Coriobacteriia bacterium]
MKAPLVLRSKGRFALLVFAATHFVVDLASALLLFHFLTSFHLFALCLLFYNFFAFAAEMPLGIAVDLWFRPQRFAALGCWLIVATCLLCTGLARTLGSSEVLALVIAVMVGLGNGMFHVGAGAAVIRASAGRSAPLGVFVAPGALGVFLGMLWGKSAGLLPLVSVVLLLLVCGLVIWVFMSAEDLSGAAQLQEQPQEQPQSQRLVRSARNAIVFSITGAVAVSLACLCATVVLRSYAGFSFSFSWKTGALWPVALVLGIVLGKILGGFLGDSFGLKVAAVISLSGAAVLFLFPAVPVLGVLAVLLFNMTMPLTLRAIADRLPQAPGFAFGTLTFALFAGALPMLLGAAQVVRPGWSLALLSAASLAIFFGALLVAEPAEPHAPGANDQSAAGREL